MARITSVGFETNSTGADVEASSITWSGTGLSIQTSTVRTGTYALKDIASSGGSSFTLKFSSSHSQFIRAYINISAYPAANDTILAVVDSNNGIGIGFIELTSTGALQLFYSNTSGGFTQIGSNSSILSLNTWYMIDLHADDTGGTVSTVVEGRLGGSVFATGTVSIIVSGNGGVPNGFGYFGDGIVHASSSGTWYFDDIAINDSTGSNQNSYAGAGALTRILPNAAGDSNTFSVQVGGTAGSANNFTRVNEVTPDDATSYNGSATLNQSDLFKLQDPAIGTDTVNCIQILARMVQSATNTTIKIQLQWEKAASGTVGTNTAFNPNDTAFFLTSPGHDIVAYTNPDATTITESTLATSQIGYKLTAASGTVQIRISDIWMYIDHTPAVSVANHNLSLLGVGS